MRKQVFGRQFKRDTNERKALFKGLLSALVLHNRIETTEAKAKAIKGEADKLITKVKRQGKSARRLLSKCLTDQAIKKLIKDVVPRFSSRNGGYTRIVHLGRRVTDSASMAVIEWVERYEDQRPNIKDQKRETVKEKKKEVKKEKEQKTAIKKAIKKEDKKK